MFLYHLLYKIFSIYIIFLLGIFLITFVFSNVNSKHFFFQINQNIKSPYVRNGKHIWINFPKITWLAKDIINVGNIKPNTIKNMFFNFTDLSVLCMLKCPKLVSPPNFINCSVIGILQIPFYSSFLFPVQNMVLKVWVLSKWELHIGVSTKRFTKDIKNGIHSLCISKYQQW